MGLFDNFPGKAVFRIAMRVQRGNPRRYLLFNKLLNRREDGALVLRLYEHAVHRVLLVVKTRTAGNSYRARLRGAA